MPRRLLLCAALLLGACDEPGPTPEPALTEPAPPEPEAPNPTTWAGLHRLDGRMELRVGDASRWLVLRRLSGGDWIRGYLRRGTFSARCGPNERYLAAGPDDQGAVRRFWLHASELRALLADEECALQMGLLEVDRAAAEAIADGGAQLNPEALGAPLDQGLDHAVRVRPPVQSFATRCDALVALTALTDDGWVLVDEMVPAAGTMGLPDACPEPPAWAVVDGERVPFAAVDGFLDRMSGRSTALEVCPGAASRAQLRAMAEASTLELCGPECCATIDETTRAALAGALERWDALTALAEGRPSPEALGPPPAPPD